MSATSPKPKPGRSDWFFDFVVRRLRWLAKIPPFPQLFDAMLLTHTALFHRPRLEAMEALEARVLALPGLRLRPHRFGGMEFCLDGVEIGHLHGNGLLDVHVGRSVADHLIDALPGVLPHHVFGRSAWMSFRIDRADDVPTAMKLMQEGLAFLIRQTDAAETVKQEAQRAQN